MFIFFMGPDCSGKDSLMHELAKLYNYKYYMSPRSPICNIVYDVIYGRTDEKQKNDLLTLINSFLTLNAVFVFVNVKPEILLQRALARNERHVTELETFKKHIEVYKSVIQECKTLFLSKENMFLEIDNSGNLKEAALKLKEEIDKC